MDFVKKIEGLQKKKSNEDAFGEVIYILMKELNQQYSEIMNMPLPLVTELMKLYDKEMELRKKSMKKKK